jgi:hypothetical protein
MVLSHMFYPKFNSHVSKAKRSAVRTIFVLSGNSGSKEVLLFVECPIFQSIGDRPTNMAPSKKERKKCECT